MSAQETITLAVANRIADIDAAEWDACAAGEVMGGQAATPPNPFVSHAFLKALEESGSVGARTGWQPQHLLLEGADGRLRAAMPCYLKSHSFGEYVFDHSWAHAFERAGGRYYPKLQVSVPFTPATGPRLLVRASEGRAEARQALASGLIELTRRHDASSAHLTFLTRAEWESLAELGFLARTDSQFHWTNDDYAEFDAFLAALASRKRKQIRKERRDALADGITVEWATGKDLTEAHWDAFWTFYQDTGARKWGRPYLTRAFFSLVGQAMPERILLVLAKRAGRYVAGALNFIGADALYGRNWGCVEEHPFLHFELCYYQAIDFAIAHGLERVEAGAQGEHKLARGYEPVTTYSSHYIAHPGLRRAIADFLAAEQREVAMEQELLAEHTPFRKVDESA
jgi:predicted N-acyltransferase